MSNLVRFSPEFEGFIKKTRKENKVSRLIWTYIRTGGYSKMGFRMIKPEISFIKPLEGGSISFVPKNKLEAAQDDYCSCGQPDCGNNKDIYDEDSRYGRQTGKPTKTIRKIFTEFALKFFKDKDFDDFGNKLVSFSDKKLTFHLLPNTEISKVYKTEISEEVGELHKSCMKNQVKEVFDLYENCSKLQILALKDDFGYLAGRALIWKINKDITFMDRIYTNKPYQRDMFIEYAKENKWWRKKHQSYDEKTAFIDSEGLTVHKLFRIKTPVEFKLYPYLDTFTYGGDGFLTNNNHQKETHYLQLSSTGGDYLDRRKDYFFDEIVNAWDEKDAGQVIIEAGEHEGRRTRMSRAKMVNGKYYWEDSELICSPFKRDQFFLKTECTLLNGRWYHNSDLVSSQFYAQDICKLDAVFSEFHKEWVKNTDVKTIQGVIYHEGFVPIEIQKAENARLKTLQEIKEFKTAMRRQKDQEEFQRRVEQLGIATSRILTNGSFDKTLYNFLVEVKKFRNQGLGINPETTLDLRYDNKAPLVDHALMVVGNVQGKFNSKKAASASPCNLSIYEINEYIEAVDYLIELGHLNVEEPDNRTKWTPENTAGIQMPEQIEVSLIASLTADLDGIIRKRWKFRGAISISADKRAIEFKMYNLGLAIESFDVDGSYIYVVTTQRAEVFVDGGIRMRGDLTNEDRPSVGLSERLREISSEISSIQESWPSIDMPSNFNMISEQLDVRADTSALEQRLNRWMSGASGAASMNLQGSPINRARLINGDWAQPDASEIAEAIQATPEVEFNACPEISNLNGFEECVFESSNDLDDEDDFFAIDPLSDDDEDLDGIF